MASIFEELDKIISPSYLIEDGVPAVSIAILDDGKISSHAIGKAVDTSTIFEACSISKAITALAVAKLIDQGILSYDMKIKDHLPEDILASLTGPNTRQLLPYITLSHILSHTAGISQGGFEGYPITAKQPFLTQLIKGEYPSNSTALRLMAPPGSQFSYSGGGFCLLQYILTNVLKKPFPDLMHDLVLEPLKMTRSHFGPLPSSAQNFSSAHKTAHTPADASHHDFPEQAAAGLWTTPSDLLLAINAIQKSLKGDQDSFITQKTAKAMLTTVIVVSERGEMANGWVRNGDLFGHNGSNDPGYRCTLVGTEDASERGIAVMTGSQYGADALSKVCQAVAYLKGWKPVEMLGTNDCVPYAAKVGTEPDHRWKEWIGKWEEGWKIVEEDGRAKVVFGELPPLKMVPAATPSIEDGIVFVVEDLRLEVTLATEDGKNVVKLLQGLESSDRAGARKTLKKVE